MAWLTVDVRPFCGVVSRLCEMERLGHLPRGSVEALIAECRAARGTDGDGRMIEIERDADGLRAYPGARILDALARGDGLAASASRR